MNIIVWLVIGGLIGWVASVFTGSIGRQAIILNIVVGVVGATLGGWLFGNAVSNSTVDQGILSIGGQMVSLVAAIILIAIVKVLRSATAR